MRTKPMKVGEYTNPALKHQIRVELERQVREEREAKKAELRARRMAEAEGTNIFIGRPKPCRFKCGKMIRSIYFIARDSWGVIEDSPELGDTTTGLILRSHECTRYPEPEQDDSDSGH